MKNLIYLYIFLFSGALIGQQRIQEKLSPDMNFPEVMQTVEDHFRQLQSQGKDKLPGEPSYKKWKRWEWYISSRLASNNEFVNVSKKTQKAYQQEKKRIAQTGRTTSAAWSFIGPDHSTYGNSWTTLNGLGRVDRITFHPTNPNIIYLGTPSGGLWKTTDGGGSWTPLTDHITEKGISGIVVSHANDQVIYALTGDGDGGGFIEGMGYLSASTGVIKSTDGGINWTQTGGPQSSQTFYGYRLRQHPTNANILFAATSIGIFKTTNGGVNWYQVRSGKTYDLEFKPGSPSTVYASVTSGVVYSNDTGETWNMSASDESFCANGRVEIAVSPDAPDRVYALAGPAVDTGVYCGLFGSMNSGLGFTRVNNTPNILGGYTDGQSSGDQSDYDLGVAVSPSSANIVITAGLNLWKSTNFGGTMYNLTTYREDSNESWYVHPDIHDVAYNPLNGYLYAAGDGGFHRSTDDGENWTNLSAGIATTQIYHMRGIDTDPDVFGIGSQDNGIKFRTDNSSDVPHISSGDGFDIAFAAGDPNVFYASINQGVNYYWNGGANATTISPAKGWFKPLATHISDHSMVFVGSDTIFRSDDYGASWDTLSGARGTWSIITCPSNANRVYSAGAYSYVGNTQGKIYRSDNLGDDWVVLSSNPGFATSFTKVTDLKVHPTNASEIWATMGGFDPGEKVYRSLNSGNSWTNMSGTLPDVPINCVDIDQDGTAYIGTDIGVYFRTTTMSDWHPFSNLLPVVPVTDIEIYDQFIRASTFGRGVWESPKPGTCSIAYNFTQELSGVKYYQASSTISATSEVSGGFGTHIVFKAGSYVRLDPGFIVNPGGNVFQAIIGSCTSGGVPSGM